MAGAGAEIMDKVGAGAENKLFRLRNTAWGSVSEPVEPKLFWGSGVRNYLINLDCTKVKLEAARMNKN